MERTCVIVKPDGIGKKVVGKIFERFENEGLKLSGLKMIRPSRKHLENFYSMHKGKPFLESYLDFISCGPIIASVWEGKNAIKHVRQLIGATDSRKADPCTLRAVFGTDGTKNLVHASDSPENAIREIKFFFSDSEIMQYNENYWKSFPSSEEVLRKKASK
ncbi:MAG: nucleoside-diphosphate kinase [Elusimicrobiota bacterium]